MNKKAITPLIATILLIGFVVVMGSLVFSWYTKTIEENAQNVEENIDATIQCSNQVSYAVSDVVAVFGAGGTDVRFVVENTGTIKIDKFLARIGSTTQKINANLEVADITQLVIQNSGTQNITIFPIVTSNGNENVCANHQKRVAPRVQQGQS